MVFKTKTESRALYMDIVICICPHLANWDVRKQSMDQIVIIILSMNNTDKMTQLALRILDASGPHSQLKDKVRHNRWFTPIESTAFSFHRTQIRKFIVCLKLRMKELIALSDNVRQKHEGSFFKSAYREMFLGSKSTRNKKKHFKCFSKIHLYFC